MTRDEEWVPGHGSMLSVNGDIKEQMDRAKLIKLAKF